jgi:hypothetical protein
VKQKIQAEKLPRKVIFQQAPMFSNSSQTFFAIQNGSRCRASFFPLAQKHSRRFSVDFADTLQ